MSRALADEAATLAAGARLGAALAALAPGDTPASGLHVHLSGLLGAGKTTLVRGALRALGEAGPVRSPTYTLMEPYEVGGLHLHHFDLYRVAGPEELELIGARDLFRQGSVCLFEWPERGAGWLPAADLVLHLETCGNGRTLRVTARSRPGSVLAAAVLADPNCSS